MGDRYVRVSVSGSGVPVVFEAGAGSWSDHWSLVTQAIGGSYRCISYDRAGLGSSDPASGVRSAGVLAVELLQVCDATGVDEPAIFVAHSFGASIVRLAASLAPERVKGVVFVDGWHESFAAWERCQGSPAGGVGVFMAGLSLLDRIGIFRMTSRLWNRLFPPACPWPLAQETWRSILSISTSSGFIRAAEREARAYEAGDADVAAVRSLGVPVCSLVSSCTLNRKHAPPGYPVAEHNAAWRAASARLSDLSPRSITRILHDTDHMIPLANSGAVIEAISELEEMIERQDHRESARY